MTPLEDFVSRLTHVRPKGDGWVARCPAHDDNQPSLSVHAGDDGRVLVKCFAGCHVEAICQAVGMEVRQLFVSSSSVFTRNTDDKDTAPLSPVKPWHRPAKAGEHRVYPTVVAAMEDYSRKFGPAVGHWFYERKDGGHAGLVVRWNRRDGKVILPFRPHVDGGWECGAMPTPRPPYRFGDLAAAQRVIVVEGEACADAARSLGFIATTCAGGAMSATQTSWRALAGKEVWIIPDNDAPGRKFAETVRAILVRNDPSADVTVVELPGLPPKGDIVDWIGHSPLPAASTEDFRKQIEGFAAEAKSRAASLSDGPAPFEPFPVNALPEPVRTFVVAAADCIGCDPSFVALPVLTAAAAAIGTSRRLQLKRGWTVPSILWCAVVGDSGTSKTPAFRLALRPMEGRDDEAFDTHQRSLMDHEKAMAKWDKEQSAWSKSKGAGDPPDRPIEPVAVRHVVADTTVEALAPILRDNPRGILMARDELAGWLGSFDRYSGKGCDAANWLSMFNGMSLKVDRKTGTPRTIHVKEAAVCVVGGIQPEILRTSLTADLRANGMAARLLVACPPRRAKTWTEADLDPRIEGELSRAFDRLFALDRDSDGDGGSFPVIRQLTPEAKAQWITYYAQHAQEQQSLEGDLAAAWSKLEEYAARLALVVHCLKGDEGDVDRASMEAGIVLATWFKREAARVYAMLSQETPVDEAGRLREWIAGRGGSATVRQVVTGCRWLRPMEKAERVMAEVVADGEGEWRASSGGRGQPTERLVVSLSSVIEPNTDDKDTPPGRLFPERRGLPD